MKQRVFLAAIFFLIACTASAGPGFWWQAQPTGGGGGGGVTSLGAIGAAPNANAGTIAGTTLTLQPASGSFGGVLTTGTQTIAGTKTFSSLIAADGGVDRSSAAALALGATNATTLNLGRTGQTQALLGNGTVAGTFGVTGTTTLSGVLAVTPASPADTVTVAPTGSPTGDTFILTAGTLADGKRMLRSSATLSSAAAAQTGASYGITTAGSAAGDRTGMSVFLNSGYTGSGRTLGLQMVSGAAGTATDYIGNAIGPNVGADLATQVGGADGSAPVSIGAVGRADFGSAANIGLLGKAGQQVTSTGPAIGVMGTAGFGGSSSARIGVYAGLLAANPTYTGFSTALLANNGAVASPIALFQDNGSTVITIADGGLTTFTQGVTLSGVGQTFSAVTTDVTTGTNEDFTISPNGTGLVVTTKGIRVSGVTTDIDAAASESLRVVGGTSATLQLGSRSATGIEFLDTSDTVRGTLVVSSSQMTFRPQGAAIPFQISNTANQSATQIHASFQDNGATNFAIYGEGAIKHKEQVATCAAGVLALDPQSSYISIDPAGAACVVTIAETSAATIGPGFPVTIAIVASAGAGAVTFPNVANVFAGPALCTTTGLTINGTMEMMYVNKTDDMFLSTGCQQN